MVKRKFERFDVDRETYDLAVRQTDHLLHPAIVGRQTIKAMLANAYVLGAIDVIERGKR